MKINFKFFIWIIIILALVYVFKPLSFVTSTSGEGYAPVYLIVPDYSKVNSPVELQLISTLKFADNPDNTDVDRRHAVYLDDENIPLPLFKRTNTVGSDGFVNTMIIPADRLIQAGKHKIKVVYTGGGIIPQCCFLAGQEVYDQLQITPYVTNYASLCLDKIWQPSTCSLNNAFLRQQSASSFNVITPNSQEDGEIIAYITVLSETEYQTITNTQVIETTKYVNQEMFSFNGFWQYIKNLFNKIIGG